MMLHALAQSLADLPRLCDPLQAETVAVKSIGVENSISWKQPAVIVATSVLLVMVCQEHICKKLFICNL